MADKKPHGNFFGEVYKARTAEETRALYDDWASEYDATVSDAGYATPMRMAQSLAGILDDPTLPILDFGCGTGVSGDALREVGFTTVDGMDVADNMLNQAHEKGVYRTLSLITPGEPLAVAHGAYAVVQACGVIGAGAAPVNVLEQLLAPLRTGQLLSFSLNDHALADPDTSAFLETFKRRDDMHLLVQDYGEHLPALGMKSAIYIFERR